HAEPRDGGNRQWGRLIGYPQDLLTWAMHAKPAALHRRDGRGVFPETAGPVFGDGNRRATLVRMANGLIPHFHAGAFDGTVWVDGAETRTHAVRDLARTVGVVFQNHEAQLFNATVERELAFGPRQQGLAREAITARIRTAAEQTGITHLLSRPTTHLSGGERARVAIASILTMQPPLLILDEPSAALDPRAADGLWMLLAALHERGTTIAVAEHRPGRLWEYATSVAAMQGGRLGAHGPCEEVLRVADQASPLPVPAIARLCMEAGLSERPRTATDAANLLRARSLTLQSRPAITAATGEPLLVAEAVRAERDRRVVLKSIDLRLHRGETVALVGTNGAGKTTLLRLLAGLARPQGGRITGADGLPVPRQRIGMLLQHADDALFCRTVREEVEYSARTLGRYDAAWMAILVGRFALVPLLERPPLGLSDGEKRRVALAAMLAHRPEIVLLDEPTAGQDRQRREALSAMLTTLRAEGIGVILATHDMAFAAATCPRWLLLSEGALIADAPPATVMNDPALLARAHLLRTPIADLAAALGVPYTSEDMTLVPARRGSEFEVGYPVFPELRTSNSEPRNSNLER
ncbi:MAG: energy-coupling factor ABC transporter ATP-binding protein, partial [Thermomicrobia bacterium]|nr:energy-coupling factor ABC transporter ATP-binding protein [Thermomicrobia bacterium]